MKKSYTDISENENVGSNLSGSAIRHADKKHPTKSQFKRLSNFIPCSMANSPVNEQMIVQNIFKLIDA